MIVCGKKCPVIIAFKNSIVLVSLSSFEMDRIPSVPLLITGNHQRKNNTGTWANLLSFKRLKFAKSALPGSTKNKLLFINVQLRIYCSLVCWLQVNLWYTNMRVLCILSVLYSTSVSTNAIHMPILYHVSWSTILLFKWSYKFIVIVPPLHHTADNVYDLFDAKILDVDAIPITAVLRRYVTHVFGLRL